MVWISRSWILDTRREKGNKGRREETGERENELEFYIWETHGDIVHREESVMWFVAEWPLWVKVEYENWKSRQWS